MAAENERAARAMQRSDMPRSAASRAYYAVYALVAERLHAAGVQPGTSPDRSGPSHASLPVLCEHNLAGLKTWERRDLKAAARRLYARRVEADYIPHVAVGEPEARSAMSDMAWALGMLRRGGERC